MDLMSIRIVTDSNCDHSRAMVDEYDLTVRLAAEDWDKLPVTVFDSGASHLCRDCEQK